MDKSKKDVAHDIAPSQQLEIGTKTYSRREFTWKTIIKKTKCSEKLSAEKFRDTGWISKTQMNYNFELKKRLNQCLTKNKTARDFVIHFDSFFGYFLIKVFTVTRKW